MNLYLLTQSETKGYDTYDSVVVAAVSEEEARHIPPSLSFNYETRQYDQWPHDEWATTPANVTAKLIGVAAEGVERGVILASYNAG
jgi:hypothetical protein